MSPQSTTPRVEPAAPRSRAYRWYHKLFALTFIVFCLEIGVVLLILPWSEYWDENYLSSLTQQWRGLWDNAYLRGAVSGLGIVNIYISVSELFGLRRFRR
ncbi:MAG: hypothetical protein HYR60_20115 [Acidobacteria bacterium]|nr:hypothetical protein [Acidobacteriota bacterium]MBI3472834.1 hypothetical protein [Candidatus Solibacter usitatus]